MVITKVFGMITLLALVVAVVLVVGLVRSLAPSGVRPHGIKPNIAAHINPGAALLRRLPGPIVRVVRGLALETPNTLRLVLEPRCLGLPRQVLLPTTRLQRPTLGVQVTPHK